MAATQVGLTFPGERLADLPTVEGWGFDSVWTSEHILHHGPTSDATVTLGAFAAVTKRLTIGSAIVLLPLRHPTVTAKAIATADLLSGGRVVLGIGVGGEYPKEFEATGVPLHERGARTNDAIRVLKKLWSADHVSHHSRFVDFDDVTMQPKPAQAGGPPIVVAGRSEAALRRAARLGDGYMPYLFTPERFAEAKRHIGQQAEEAGRDLSGFHWMLYQFTSLAPTYEAARERALTDLSRRYAMPFDKVVDRYCALGTAEQVAERLRAFTDAGVAHLILAPIVPRDAYLDAIEQYARDLLPLVRS